jgi:hypothetical protein
MQYTEITREQMQNFLTQLGLLEVLGMQSTRERVFDFTIVNGHIDELIVVRVYTSIHKDTDVCRNKGADAIRVCAVNLTKNIGWIRTTKVLRVEGWRDNLYRAIKRTINQATVRYEKQFAARRAA